MKASRDEEKGVGLVRFSPFQRFFPRFLRRRWRRDADAFCHRLKATFTFNFYKILKITFNSLARISASGELRFGRSWRRVETEDFPTTPRWSRTETTTMRCGRCLRGKKQTPHAKYRSLKNVFRAFRVSGIEYQKKQVGNYPAFTWQFTWKHDGMQRLTIVNWSNATSNTRPHLIGIMVTYLVRLFSLIFKRHKCRNRV